jgi:hypothetical protein
VAHLRQCRRNVPLALFARTSTTAELRDVRPDLELVREIRRRHPALRVRLTTGYVESLAGMDDGEFGVLLKPYTVQALANALGIEVQAREHQNR